MKTRAAVAWESGKPLEIEMLDLEGPKAGEVLIRNVASGVCHTDAFTLSGEDPEGIFPAVLGRVCSRPCEDVCRHGREGLGEPVAICFSKRAAADMGSGEDHPCLKLAANAGKSSPQTSSKSSSTIDKAADTAKSVIGSVTKGLKGLFSKD